MNLYEERDLEKATEKMFDTKENRTKFGARSLNMYVSTSPDNYQTCLEDIEVSIHGEGPH